MIRKSFKITGIILELDGSEDGLFIYHNPLLEDYQVMVEHVEQPTDEQEERCRNRL